MGYDFTGGSEDYEKGCYAYYNKTDLGDFTGRVYYGTGGTKKQMKKSLELPKYRPQGHDCSEGKSQFFIVNVERRHVI